MSEQTTSATWRDMFDRMVELGLGAALLTREAATKLVDDMVKKGSMTREDGHRVLNEMVEKGREQKQRMEEVVAEVVDRVLTKSDLARRSQIEELERRVALLEAKLRMQTEGPDLPWDNQ